MKLNEKKGLVFSEAQSRNLQKIFKNHKNFQSQKYILYVNEKSMYIKMNNHDKFDNLLSLSKIYDFKS